MPKSLPIVRMVTCVALALLVSTAWGDTPMVTPADGEVMAPGHDAYLEPVASDSSVVVAGGGVNDRLRPDPEGMEVSVENGITGWSAGEHIVWYGQFPTAGRVDLRLALRLPAGERSTLKLRAESWQLSRHGDRSRALAVDVTGAEGEVTVPLGAIDIRRPGPYRFTLEGVSRTGATFGAPSVHLSYPAPADAKLTWFYNEMTPTKTPLWSYFMACGFSRGYFGIQVNSATERRIIFSVWDSGKEPTDRSKVADDDRVRLIAKGADVFTDSFGNEGTGGHSHLVYPWKTGQTYRFLVSAQPDGTGTIYSGYFYFPEKKAWGLMASFRAPKDGGTLRGLFSFNEDFGDGNGYLQRYALFGPAWVRAEDGAWTELTTARFSYTDDVKERPDRGGGVAGRLFYLSNGGYVPTPDVRKGDTFTRPASGSPPNKIELPPIPAAP